MQPFDDLDILEEDVFLSRVLIHKLAHSSQFIPFTSAELDRRLDGFMPSRLESLEKSVRFELSSFEPRRLVNYSGAWYCFAVDCQKSEIRNFKLSRIQTFELLAASQYSDLKDDAIDALIDNSYGAYKGVETIRATVRFYGAARSIVEHEVWHPEQSSEAGTESDGRRYLQLTIPVYCFDELLGRVLRFGSSAVPIEPSEFLSAWIVEIRRMNANIPGV